MYLSNAFSLQMLSLDRAHRVNVMPVSLDVARNMVQTDDGFISIVGHSDTAVVLSGLLGVEVSCNRTNIQLGPDDRLLVAQLVGGRLPEGATTLPDGFTFRFVLVTVK